MTLKAIGEFIVLEDSKTKVGKFTMTETHKGKVISVGPGLFTANGTKIPMSVQVGETVIVEKQNRRPLKLEEDEYLLLRESEILMNSNGI